MASLTTLRIRNLVIIEDLTAEFGSGLNLLTGETGAGKSILVDALGLVVGARADRSLVRSGSPKATVEALFEIEADSTAARWLQERMAEPDDGQLLIQREIPAEGSGRVLLNGSPATLGMLRELASHLLELHGQHDPKSLLAADRHLELLDRFGGHHAELEAVQEAFGRWREVCERQRALEASAGDQDRLDGLRRLIEAIDNLAPQAGELERWAIERRLLKNSGRVAELCDRIVQNTVIGDPSAASLAASAASAAEELAEMDAGLEQQAQRIRAAAVELDDVGGDIVRYRDSARSDPQRLEELESRAATLERLCLEQATDEAGLLVRREEAAESLRAVENLDQERDALAREREEIEAGYLKRASQLTAARCKAATKLNEAVKKQLKALALGRAEFAVGWEPARGHELSRPGKAQVVIAAGGAERAEFLWAANPGEKSVPLRQSASGGELSRVMLALHVAGAGDGEGRAIVFDEIDSGVSGAVADAVGARLQKLAASHQLLCITHLPQVAAYADAHFRVSKHVSGGRTRTSLDGLDGAERVEELARMLAGKQATATSRDHASELLNAAGRKPSRRTRSQA